MSASAVEIAKRFHVSDRVNFVNKRQNKMQFKTCINIIFMYLYLLCEDWGFWDTGNGLKWTYVHSYYSTGTMTK